MKYKKPNFIPIIIGYLSLANGRNFTIRQVHKKGSCSITNEDDNISYAGSEAKAWASVRYMGRIIYKTERSVA